MAHSTSLAENQTSAAMARVYLIASGAAALLLSMSVFSGPEVSELPFALPLKILFLAMVALTLKYRTSGVLLLLLVADLAIREPVRGERPAAGAFYDAVLAMFLIVTSARFRTCQKATGKPELAGVFRPLISRQPLSVPLASLATGARNVLVCVVSAWLLLAMIPPSDTAIQDVRLHPNVLRAMTVVLVLTSIWLVTAIVLNHLAWRNLSPGQSRVYLRSAFLQWFHRDFRLMIRRQLKLRQRRVRKSVEPPALSLHSPARQEPGHVTHP